MYQSFTGTSRRPRQVNLSGRPSNPFAAQNAVAAAQQDRKERQLTRERRQASVRVQKTWRGYSSRRRTFRGWKSGWDTHNLSTKGAYSTSNEALQQLRRLFLFYNPLVDGQDVQRLAWSGTRQIATAGVSQESGSSWIRAYVQLRKACLKAITPQSRGQQSKETDEAILQILAFTATRAAFTSVEEATAYYGTLSSAANLPKSPLEKAFIAPLQGGKLAYAGLVRLLAKALPEDLLGLLHHAVDSAGLADAVAKLGILDTEQWSKRERLWLLGNLIALTSSSRGTAFQAIVASLLGSLSDDVDFEGQILDVENATFDREALSVVTTGFPLNTYLHKNVSKLIDQDSIRSLIAADHHTKSDAHISASYALTLLRCFPRRADEIRMWLYRGPVISSRKSSPTDQLLMATKSTTAFQQVMSSPKTVSTQLKDRSAASRDDWTTILLFFELLIFVLKIMDDDEFMRSRFFTDVADLVTFLKNLGFTLSFEASELQGHSNDTIPTLIGNMTYQPPSTTSEPLLIAGVPGLTADYLKGVVTGLLRALYDRDSRRNFLPSNHWLMTQRFEMTSFIEGVILEQEKRESIEADEDDEEDEDDLFDEDDGMSARTRSQRFANGDNASSISRAARAQQARFVSGRSAERKRYLEAVAPRLEILQNMPFFIPFHTRVEIFRQFVAHDQLRRRNGTTDPDLWRQMIMLREQNAGVPPASMLARHHAEIKRGHEFEDAFSKFYNIGADFKEPIQITFVDAFDMTEAGIDGGGVTKEFLTSLVSRCFGTDAVGGPDGETLMFVENDKHLLYPNPTALEDLKAWALSNPSTRNTQYIRDATRLLLQHYEFLGRVIGKCMYEGILVDVNFAGFFLKKWALTGGIGNAALESGYRATLNDLRDLDEDLYKGLLQLKNAEDASQFGLTFTVADVVGYTDADRKVIEHDLAPGGANLAVTHENRLLYINRLAYYRLQGQSKRETDAFLKGIGSIIQPSWLSMFNQNELQTLIGGAAAGIDVQDLRRNTQYGGTYVVGDDGLEHPSVQMFWRVMQNMADEDRRKVLKFVTSTPRGPLLGFGHLNPKFSIRDSGSDENRFPTTSTCVNLLKLPMYRSEKVLKEKLLAAVNSGAGFDLS